MSTTETLPTTYRGYFIDKETDPWRKKSQDNVRFSHGSNIDEEPGFIYWASDLDEAKEMIDDLIAEKETPEPPSSPLSISGDNHKLEALLFMIRDYKDILNNQCRALPSTYKSLENQFKICDEWMGIITQQIKDNNFEFAQWAKQKIENLK